MARRQTQEPAPPLPGAFTETFDSFYTRGAALDRQNRPGPLTRRRQPKPWLRPALIRWDQLHQPLVDLRCGGQGDHLPGMHPLRAHWLNLQPGEPFHE